MGVGHGPERLVRDARQGCQENPVAGLDGSDLNAHFFIIWFASIFYKQNSRMLHCVKTIYCPMPEGLLDEIYVGCSCHCCGGCGIRAGGELPKQYQLIGGRPVMWWTLKAFAEHPGVSHIQTVIGAGHTPVRRANQGFAGCASGYRGSNPAGFPPPRSGRLRGASAQRVLIHDAARPFVSADLISKVIAELQHSQSVIPGLPVADTIKLAPGGMIERTINRQSLWTVQTPQGFARGPFARHTKAHEENLQGLTHDAAVAEKFGIKVRVIAGRAEIKKSDDDGRHP